VFAAMAKLIKSQHTTELVLESQCLVLTVVQHLSDPAEHACYYKHSHQTKRQVGKMCSVPCRLESACQVQPPTRFQKLSVAGSATRHPAAGRRKSPWFKSAPSMLHACL
jgi:hypothetical protein